MSSLRPLLIGVVLVSLFSFFFVSPTHDPKPNDLPVGVIGTAQPARPVAGTFEVHRYTSEDAAREALLDREIYAAFGPQRTLLASGASFQVASLLRASGPSEDVVPLDPDDPRGTTIQFAVLALTVPGILGAMLLMQLRNVAYFDGAALTEPLLVLLAFAGAGAALLLLSGRPGPSPQPA